MFCLVDCFVDCSTLTNVLTRWIVFAVNVRECIFVRRRTRGKRQSKQTNNKAILLLSSSSSKQYVLRTVQSLLVLSFLHESQSQDFRFTKGSHGWFRRRRRRRRRCFILFSTIRSGTGRGHLLYGYCPLLSLLLAVQGCKGHGSIGYHISIRHHEARH